VAPSYPNVTGNWQIQSGLPAPIPAGLIVLLGALQSSGGQVSGTFRFTELAQPTACGLNQVVTVVGTVDAKNNLILTSAALPDGSVVKVQLVIPSAPASFAAGTIEVTGGACAVSSGPASGVEIPPVTGTFAGTLAPGPAGTMGSGSTGTATLEIAQATAPTTDGQFSVTGPLTFTFGSCTGKAALSGDASGVEIMLSSSGTPLTALPAIRLLGTAAIPASNAVIADSLEFFPSPCSADPLSSAVYSGTLARQ
jgi:hypothetical protein